MDKKTDLDLIAHYFKERFAKRWENFYPDHEYWRDIFKVFPSQHSQETDVELKLPGLAPVSHQDASEQKVTDYVHKSYDFGFSLSEDEAREGWTSSLENHCNRLFHHMIHVRENAAAAVFDDILASPKFEKNRQNTVFSRQAYEKAVISLGKVKESSGLYAALKPTMLMVPADLQFEVHKQIPREYFYHGGVNVVIHPYLKNPSAWFLITDAPDGFKCFERQKPDVSVFVAKDESLFLHDKPNPDFKPEIIFKISARYSFGCTNPNVVFASTGERESK